jgi:hypothetical protein
MGEWRVQVSVRVSPAKRAELEQCAEREKRSLANFGAVLLEWAFEQFRVVGSTDRLLRFKIRNVDPPRRPLYKRREERSTVPTVKA